MKCKGLLDLGQKNPWRRQKAHWHPDGHLLGRVDIPCKGFNRERKRNKRSARKIQPKDREEEGEHKIML